MNIFGWLLGVLLALAALLMGGAEVNHPLPPSGYRPPVTTVEPEPETTIEPATTYPPPPADEVCVAVEPRPVECWPYQEPPTVTVEPWWPEDPPGV